MPDESAQARGTMGYASYATMARGFGPGFDAPLIIAAKLPAPGAGPAAAGLAGLAAAIRATPGVAGVTPPVVSADGQAAMMIAYPATGEQDPATNALVNRIDGTVLPRATAGTGIRAYLTGPNAGNVAFANIIGQRLPWLVRGGGAGLDGPAHGGVQVGGRGDQGRGDEPAVDLRRLWRAGHDHPAWLGPAAVRLPRGHAGHDLGAGVPVRHPVRAVHGLRGLPAVADPRALRRDRRQHGVGGPRAGQSRPG